MSKRTRYVLISLCGLALAMAAALWYWGWIPVASGPDRAGIRHALNISVLPASLSINNSYTDAWTDYIFKAQLDIDPADFPRLLQGREYVQSSDPPRESGYTSDPTAGDWVYTDQWVWSLEPEGMDPICTIYTTADRNRVFLVYMAD